MMMTAGELLLRSKKVPGASISKPNLLLLPVTNKTLGRHLSRMR